MHARQFSIKPSQMSSASEGFALPTDCGGAAYMPNIDFRFVLFMTVHL